MTAPTDRMPEPGDLITAFSPQPGRCFRMVYSRQLQATHCYQPPAWKGIWRDRMGKSWCAEHAPKMTQSLNQAASETSSSTGHPSSTMSV